MFFAKEIFPQPRFGQGLVSWVIGSAYEEASVTHFHICFCRGALPNSRVLVQPVGGFTHPVRRFGLPSFHPLSEGLAGPLSGELAHPVRRFAPPARLIEQPSELQWLNSLETTCSPGND